MYLNLKKCRGERKLTIRKLSALSGVGKTTIVEIENGTHSPSIETYVKLCVAMGINPYNDLLRPNIL